MAFVEVIFGTQKADNCSEGQVSREEGMALYVYNTFMQAGALSHRRKAAKDIFFFAAIFFAASVSPGAAVAAERSPISAAHCWSMLSPCLCPLISVLVVKPQFPQPRRYFAIAFPFASVPYRKGEISFLFMHSREVMLYLFLQGCVMLFRFSPQSELFLKVFRESL